MSKPKRRPLAELLGQEDDITSSRDHVIELPTDPHVVPVKAIAKSAPTRKTTAKSAAKTAMEPKELRRNSYHASLYLPEEAQFALREIALTMRRAKPHDVMLEAMAELFEKYNKGKLARECRARISTKS